MTALKTPLSFWLVTWVLALAGAGGALGQLGKSKSSLLLEPGTISMEGLLPKPVTLKVKAEAPIYFHSKMDRAAGMMAPGTIVTLIGLAPHAYRVRGRARHGDVAGWMLPQDLLSPDPNLAANMRKLYDRQQQVQALIDSRQVALGMTLDEVNASMGKPTRKSSKLTLQGREDKLEYSIFDKVPQVMTGRDPYGNLVQNVVYVKVETGTLSVSLKDGIVDTIEETKGAPLGGGGVKIVPGPIFIR
jgi:hypothetical protein